MKYAKKIQKNFNEANEAIAHLIIPMTAEELMTYELECLSVGGGLKRTREALKANPTVKPYEVILDLLSSKFKEENRVHKRQCKEALKSETLGELTVTMAKYNLSIDELCEFDKHDKNGLLEGLYNGEVA